MNRDALDTPALIVDRAALDRNIAALAAFARTHGLSLRPHAKTHKCAAIARRQIAAGAVGVCCARLGEAEALAAAADSILITSPVVPAPAVARLAALHARVRDLRVVVDHPDNARALAAAIPQLRPLAVLIDVDPGLRRTGVADAEAAVALAHTIAASASLRYRGVQFYCGSEQHIEAFADRREALAARTEKLRAVIAALAAAGFAPGIVTGGGTGSHAIDAELGVLTELQAGSYIFMDRQYNDCALTTGNARAFETALFIDARIVSANHLGLATLDAGFKAMATDGGAPAFHAGAPEGATFRFMGDEHGALIAREHRFALGARVTLVAPHCDPTVNLYDAYHVVENETVVDVWPIEARGKGR